MEAASVSGAASTRARFEEAAAALRLDSELADGAWQVLQGCSSLLRHTNAGASNGPKDVRARGP